VVGTFSLSTHSLCFPRSLASDTTPRIFVPAEGNALAQLLLERGVNGESPLKRRSPRKSTATRTTPKNARSTKAAAATTKTPRTVSKRARKSTVAPGADEPRIAPATTTKKNKRPSTSKSKTPKSRGQRGRPNTKGVEVGGDNGGGASVYAQSWLHRSKLTVYATCPLST
jgi:hypothetical protein